MFASCGHISHELSRKVWHFLRHRGQATCEVIGRRKQGNSTASVPLRSKMTAYKEAWSLNSAPCTNILIITTWPASLKVLLKISKIHAELNKRHSWITITLKNRMVKEIVAVAFNCRNTVRFHSFNLHCCCTSCLSRPLEPAERKGNRTEGLPYLSPTKTTDHSITGQCLGHFQLEKLQRLLEWVGISWRFVFYCTYQESSVV